VYSTSTLCVINAVKYNTLHNICTVNGDGTVDGE